MPQILFQDAGAQSTCASPITNSQTTVVLASTSGFKVPGTGQQYSAIILDSGNGAFSASSPLATPYEYVTVTGNNTGTNTLTIVRGQAGTTGHAFAAGATVAAVLLAEDLNASVPVKVFESILGSNAVSIDTGTLALLGTFTDLRVRAWVQTQDAAAQFLRMTINGDSGSHYYDNFTSGPNASTPSGTVDLAVPSMIVGSMPPTSSGNWGASEMTIFNAKGAGSIAEALVSWKNWRLDTAGLVTSIIGGGGWAPGGAGVAITRLIFNIDGTKQLSAGSRISIEGVP